MLTLFQKLVRLAVRRLRKANQAGQQMIIFGALDALMNVQCMAARSANRFLRQDHFSSPRRVSHPSLSMRATMLTNPSRHHVALRRGQWELTSNGFRTLKLFVTVEEDQVHQSFGRSLSQGQPNALWILTVVVSSTSTSPASIRCKLRIFKSASSASRSWLMSLATRSRRILLPNCFNHCERVFDLDTHNVSPKNLLTVTVYKPQSCTVRGSNEY